MGKIANWSWGGAALAVGLPRPQPPGLAAPLRLCWKLLNLGCRKCWEFPNKPGSFEQLVACDFFPRKPSFALFRALLCSFADLRLRSFVLFCMFLRPSLERPRLGSAENGGVTNGGLRGVWPPFLEIGLFRPFSDFIALFQGVRRAHGKLSNNVGKKGLLSSAILVFA